MKSVLNGSSSYWKGAFSNIGKSFCGCSRVEEVEENILNSNEDLIKPQETQNYGKLFILNILTFYF
jgi:hypothetical protein